MYGVIGTGTAPAKVIVASLDDLGKDKTFYIPWYGVVTPGLEVVYDWVLDNNVEFFLVCASPSIAPKPAPKVLRTMAERVIDSEEVTRSIVNSLVSKDGIALVLWDETDEATSLEVSSLAIDSGLPTLELTNGLVPIVFNDQEQDEESVASSDDLLVEVDSDEVLEFDRETLENMPASVVKRLAKEKGRESKTKGEAIDNLVGALTMAITGSLPEVDEDEVEEDEVEEDEVEEATYAEVMPTHPHPAPALTSSAYAVFHLNSNNSVRFDLTPETMVKVWNLVVLESQS